MVNCKEKGFQSQSDMAATHLIPRLPVPHFLSSWTNDPHKIGPHGQMDPNKFGPHRQMVPQNVVPLDKSSPTNSVHLIPDPHNLSPWTNRIFLGPFVQADQIS